MLLKARNMVCWHLTHWMMEIKTMCKTKSENWQLIKKNRT